MNREDFVEALADNCDEDLQTVQKKNNDYAQGDDPFQNFRMVEDAGLTSVEKGMSDKLQRVFNLLPEGESADVDDESLEDTLSDLRNYANILQVYMEEECQ